MPLVWVPQINPKTGRPKPLRKFGPDLIALAATYNGIVKEFADQGITITLRKLYYELVARNQGGSGSAAYVYMKNRTVDFRYNKMMDAVAFEDEGRHWRTHLSFASVSDRLKSAAESFSLPMWANQKFHPLLMIEKDALLSVIDPICVRYNVPYFACKGYSDIANKYKLAEECAGIIKNGRSPVILHLGDHDPTGLDATRELIYKIQAFWECHDLQVVFGRENEAGESTNAARETPLVLKYDSIAEIVEKAKGSEVPAAYVCRLGLNYDQVKQGNSGLRGGEPIALLENPELFKVNDTRAKEYVSLYKRRGWELDALEVDILQGLIANACVQLRDKDLWDDRLADITEGKTRLNLIASEYRALTQEE